jgi:hypothetical protein
MHACPLFSERADKRSAPYSCLVELDLHGRVHLIGMVPAGSTQRALASYSPTTQMHKLRMIQMLTFDIPTDPCMHIIRGYWLLLICNMRSWKIILPNPQHALKLFLAGCL